MDLASRSRRLAPTNRHGFPSLGATRWDFQRQALLGEGAFLGRRKVPAMDALITKLKDLVGVKSWDYAERRKALRVPCKIDGTLQRGEAVMASEIRSVGMGGLSILCFGKIKKGQLVRIRCLKEHLSASYNTITCRVEWSRKEAGGYLAGVSFQEEKEILNKSWLIPELREAGVRAKNTKQKRGDVRVNCLIPARLQAGQEQRKARIRDLGTNGARIECPGETIDEGLPLTLRFGPIEHLPEVAVAAKLVSTRDFGVKHYGMSFGQFEVGDKKALRKYMAHFFKPAKPKASASSEL